MSNKNPLPEIVIAEFDDYNLMLMQNDNVISNALVINGAYQKHLEVVSEFFIKDYQNGVVLDIGSNLGSYSIPLAKKYKNLDFIGFEPQKIVYYQYCGNIFLNSLNNVTALNVAVGKRNRKISINLPQYNVENNIGGFSLNKKIIHNKNEVLLSEEEDNISIITIDSLNLENIRLIKIDVEGLEEDVILGSLKTLEKNNYPPIIFEAWGDDWYEKQKQSLFSTLEKLGYEIFVCKEDCIAQNKTNIMYNFAVENDKLLIKKLN